MPRAGDVPLRFTSRFVENADGPGPFGSSAPAESGSGVGLENTRQRLAHLYGDESRLELRRDGDWTRLVVELPFHVLTNATPTLPGGAAA